MRYWLALSAKQQASCSVPNSEIERQWSVDDFLSGESGKSKAIRSFQYIIKVLAAFIGKKDSDTLRAPS